MKILVVDDELDVQPLFEQQFRREIRAGALSFAFVYSGEQALSYLQAHYPEIGLILSDINMPAMSGLELLRRIRLRYASPPPLLVMMETAYSDEDNRRQALQQGADDFLTKPLDFHQLKAKLLAHLSSRSGEAGSGSPAV